MSEIVRSNVFTRINAILGVLFAIVLATGSLINGLFGLLIIANSAIGIIQELRRRPSTISPSSDKPSRLCAGSPEPANWRLVKSFWTM